MIWKIIFWGFWGACVVITVWWLVYAHIRQRGWIKVCAYCGKENCRLAHRWRYRPPLTHTKR